MYKLISSENFTASYTEKQLCDGIVLLSLESVCKTEPGKLQLTLEWEIDDIGVNINWSPMGYGNKTIRANWGDLFPQTPCPPPPSFRTSHTTIQTV